MSYIAYAATLIAIAVYSWGYVDANAPFFRPERLTALVYHNGLGNGLAYVGMLAVLFFWYGYILWRVRKKTMSIRSVFWYLGILVVVLLWSYPAFSNDIFNYIATARVTYLYRENPYLVMPIDIPNEPMLAFMHAANKVALYGPTWILATFIPYSVGFGNLLATLFTFKLFVVGWFFLVLGGIWKLTRRLSAVVFFAFNPLVIIDTFIDAHNDVCMMALALFALYFLRNKNEVWAWILLGLSVLVKGATLFLVPVFLYIWWKQRRNTSVDWERMWLWAAYSMFAIFLLSPLREEVYSWYFMWILPFLAVRKTWDLATAVGLGFSLGLPLRFLPYAVTRNWEGATPGIKRIITIAFPVGAWFWYILVHRTKRARNRKTR